MIKNRVIKFGNNIDTDQIIGARYLRFESIDEMVKYTFEFDENFVKNFKSGNIIVGDENFGCGSSREQAPAVLKKIGVSAILAKSFARIFYRNAINLGIPVIKCSDYEIDNFDEITIDMNKGIICNNSTGKNFNFQPFPEFLQNIIKAGGVINFRKQ
ncbi:MAG: 3-isopropylmalate dehydratase small subunit [Clostridiales bacterium]